MCDFGPEGLRAPDAARFVGIGRSTWLRLAASGRVPPGVRIGRARVWSRSELADWIAAGAPTSDRWDAMRGVR